MSNPPSRKATLEDDEMEQGASTNQLLTTPPESTHPRPNVSSDVAGEPNHPIKPVRQRCGFPKLTAYRLLVTAIGVGFGTWKAVGASNTASTLDWGIGVVATLFFFWLEKFAEDFPESVVWLFDTDYGPILGRFFGVLALWILTPLWILPYFLNEDWDQNFRRTIIKLIAYYALESPIIYLFFGKTEVVRQLHDAVAYYIIFRNAIDVGLALLVALVVVPTLVILFIFEFATFGAKGITWLRTLF